MAITLSDPELPKVKIVTDEILEKLKKIFPQAQSYQGARATEEQLKQLPPRRLLHIATHGYFLPDEAFDLVRIPTTKGQEQLYLLPAPPENPLVRSGLTFAGVNHLRSGADDGFLTALEMSGLNMQGTELVVLSACDTGLGDIVPGEGVFGIRRALQIAGVRTIVLTLWPVHDQATHFLMDTFYREIQRGNKRVDALRKAQLSLLQGNYKHPQYWGAFTICGDWRKLTL